MDPSRFTTLTVAAVRWDWDASGSGADDAGGEREKETQAPISLLVTCAPCSPSG
jgi:hypothetical protein